MSEFNSILTDKELRELLQQSMLEQDNALTEQMIDMESKIAFGTAPAIALVMPNESEMVAKLSKSFAAKSSLYTWAIGLGLSAVLGAGIYTFSGSSETQNSVPAIERNDVPAKENTVPDATPAGLPQTPVHTTAYTVAVTDTATVKKEIEKEELAEMIPPVEVNQTAPAVIPPIPPVKEILKADPIKPVGKNGAVNSNSKNWKEKAALASSIDTMFAGVKSIQVDAGVCNLSVTKTTTDRVKVKGAILVETKGLVSKKPEYEIKYERKGEVLRVWIDQSKECNIIAGSINIDASLSLEIPSGTDMDATGNSNIDLNGLDGRLCKAKTNYGDINASKLNTGFTLMATSGDVSMADCVGGADVYSTYGDVSASNHKGNMNIKVSSGDITVKGLAGDKLDIKDTYGDVTLSTITAGVSITASSGNLHLDHVNGNIDAHTTYGNQKMNDVKGNIAASSSSGDVRVETLTGNLSVKCTYGDIHATDCVGNITVKSQSGSIKGKNIQVQDALDLSATYGDIRMQLANALDELSFDLVAVSGEVSVKKNGTSIQGEEGKLHLQKGKINIKGNTTSGSQVYE